MQGVPPLTQFLLLMQFPITWSSIFITGYSSTSASFTIDTTLGRSTSFGIYVEDEEDHLIKSVTFTDSKGFLYGPYTSMSSLYDIINLKTINFPIGEEPPFDDVSFFYNINKRFTTCFYKFNILRFFKTVWLFCQHKQQMKK